MDDAKTAARHAKWYPGLSPDETPQEAVNEFLKWRDEENRRGRSVHSGHYVLREGA